MIRARMETVRAFVSVAVAALAVTVAVGCGGDDDGAAADAAPPDAMPVIEYDAGPPIDDPTAWELVSCGVEDADAGPDADAGTSPAGIGDPCCDPEGGCRPGQECISSTDNEDDSGSCRPVCALGDTCPHGGRCANFGGQKICINASTEGQDCAPELCEAEFVCIGTSEENAVCRRKCPGGDECTVEGETCQETTGGPACLPE